MTAPLHIPVKFDLLKVGHCQHPECAALRGGSRRAIDFPALVGLIEHPQRGLMLYDTGYSSHFWTATRRFPECLYRMITPPSLPPGEELLTQLESRRIAPDDIEAIFISHFHADHIAGLRDFPRARFVATRAERELCERKGRMGRLTRAYLQELLPPDVETRLSYAENASVVSMPAEWMPFHEGRNLLGDASIVGLDLPGHTASQLGMAFRTEDAGAYFLAGDACWKIEGLEQNRRPSRLAYAVFHGRTDYDETFEKLRTLHAAAHSPTIIPSHCSTTWNRLGGTRRIARD